MLPPRESRLNVREQTNLPLTPNPNPDPNPSPNPNPNPNPNPSPTPDQVREQRKEAIFTSSYP